jgi:hypothetical protein
MFVRRKRSKADANGARLFDRIAVAVAVPQQTSKDGEGRARA